MKTTARTLDKADWRILAALQKDARVALDTLAEALDMDAADVCERVRRMEETEIIAGYGATVNPRRAGYPISALVSLSAKPDASDQIVNDELAKTPEVVSCWSVTGSNDFILEILVPSLEFLEEVLTDLGKFGRLTTSIVLPSSARKKEIHEPRESMTD